MSILVTLSRNSLCHSVCHSVCFPSSFVSVSCTVTAYVISLSSSVFEKHNAQQFAKQDLCLINVRYFAMLFVFSQRGQQPAAALSLSGLDEILALVCLSRTFCRDGVWVVDSDIVSIRRTLKDKDNANQNHTTLIFRKRQLCEKGTSVYVGYWWLCYVGWG